MSAPSGALGVVVWVLLALAALVVVASCAGALAVGDLTGRLHLVTPVTSVAGPLVGVACALALGFTTSALGVLVVVGLLAATGPVLTSATARTTRSEPGGDVGPAS